MIIADDKDIMRLITCPKSILKKPPKPKAVNASVTQRFCVTSQEPSLEFQVFISYSKRMPQDFSIGLMYEDYLLYRCNGFHGTTRKGFYSAPHHAHPHAHILLINDIQNGRGAKPSQIEDLTGEYIDIITATAFFCKKCGIMNYREYLSFPECEGQLTWNI